MSFSYLQISFKDDTASNSFTIEVKVPPRATNYNNTLLTKQSENQENKNKIVQNN